MLSSKDQAVLLNLLDAITKIENYTSEFTCAEEFKEGALNFDATLMNFIIIGEMVDKLSDGFIDEHTEIEWSKIYGLRNIIAHDYFGVYEVEIWQIIQNNLPDLKKKIEAIVL